MTLNPVRNNRTISAIIPAYNEESRIGLVVEVLCKIGKLNEIVIVDDGSMDGTVKEAVRAAQGDQRLIIHHNEQNLGKGQAVYNGWKASSSSVLLLLDADLINLDVEHVLDLIGPVLNDSVDMTIGYFIGGYWRADLAHRITPWLSGQRCLRSVLLRSISWEAAEGYGFETALTMAARENNWKCGKVPLVTLTHPLGEIPRGGYHGWGTKFLLFYQVFRAWYLSRKRGNAIEWIIRRVRTG
jgi:glycosyltransferase involved in cell wall biosynthesis